MLDTATGEVEDLTLMHEGNQVREFYSSLPQPVLVGIEAGGSMPWFLNLMEQLGIECRVGHPAQIRAAEPRKQKHDRRDAELILKLLAENRFPVIWLPNKEQLDLRALLLHRHQWVRMRTRDPITRPVARAETSRQCHKLLDSRGPPVSNMWVIHIWTTLVTKGNGREAAQSC